jgi:germination protein M
MKRLTILLSTLVLVVAACGSGDPVGDAGPVTTSAEPGVETTLPPTDPGTDATTTTMPPADKPTTSTTTTTAAPQATRFVDVYFVQDGGYATSVATAVPATIDVAANAIRALIAGPTPGQQAAGLSSSVPTDTLLLGITIDDGLAKIDLSREFEAGGGSFSMISRLAQVVYTLTQFPTIDEVEFWLDGTPVTVFSAEGLLLEEPVGRGDYLAALPLTPTLLDSVDRWEQADLPATADFATDQLRNVVLVAEDDVLNVRLAAGVDHEIIGMLAPGTQVGLTGPRTEVGNSTWVEIVTPAGAGWVNNHFLAEVVDDTTFAGDHRVIALLDDMAEVVAARGDLSAVAGSRGIYIAHHADPVPFSPGELVTALSDSTTYKWPSNALNADDPNEAAEIPSRTFAEAIGDRYASTWDDPDRMYQFDQAFEGGNGRVAEFAIPFELSGFHFVSVYDPGDNPDYGGLDWTIWHVSFDYEDGAPVVVGLTLDEWSP